MEEIREIWLLLDEEISWFACALRFLLVTGQRPGELLGARRADFDLERCVWTIEQNKTGQPHIVPLSPLAQQLLHSISSNDISPFLIFGKDGQRAVERTSLSQAIRRFCTKRGLKPFTPHDLRRTVTTHLRRLGIPPYVVDRIQNRTEQSVQARHYDRWTYQPEKAQALNVWATELERNLRESAKLTAITRLSKHNRIAALQEKQ
jgi:integrase